MSDAIYHETAGVVFGHKPADPYAYGLVSADGLEDVGMTSGALDAGGSDGRGLAPMWAEVGGWVSVVEIYGATAAEWAERRDALRRATSPVLDRNSEITYDMVYGDEDVRTRFCRPSRRIIPTNEDYLVRRNITAQIAYTANDPYTYGPDTATTLDPGEALNFDSTGWAMSQRWSWVVAGPVVNPQIALTPDGTTGQILRYVGSVAGGEELRVESTPHGLVTTLDGVNVYGSFDGGSAVELPGFFSIPPGDCNLLYDTLSGAGTSVFTWRTAYI